MAYAALYRFVFQSMNGAEVKIEVLKDGYSGTVTQRALGSAPILRQQFSGGVAGTSLAFTPECLVDGEFSQFYTSDAKEFRVDLYRSSTKVWSGFIVPELYSEPDIAPPYDVNITAADGLGELKRYDFLPLGKVTLHALFTSLLSYTGQSLNVCYISRLTYSGISYNAFFTNTYIDVDYKAGKTCYDVLQYLLATFHATICYYDGAWLIARENDITFDGSNRPYYITNGGAVSYFANGLMDVTAMGGGGLWPVDFTSTTIDPALRSVKVTAPWNLVSGLLNSGMTSDVSWTKSQYASYDTNTMGYLLMPYASIYQSRTQLLGKPFLLTFYAATYLYGMWNRKPYSEAVLQVLFTVNNTTYSLAEDDSGGLYWDDSGTTDISYKIENGVDRDTAMESQLTIPTFLDSNGDPVSGTLKIQFTAGHTGELGTQGLRLFGAYLTTAAENGYQDIISINNGARGEAGEVEIAVGYETSDLTNYKDFYAGLLLNGSSNLITSLSTQNFSSLDFLALISRDYARSVALPRLRTDGTLDTPSSLVTRPLMVYYRNAYRWIETYEWNLLEDNFDFSALGIPAATLSVSTETLTPTGSASGTPENTIGRLSPGSGQEGLTIMLSNYAHVFEAGANGYAYQSTDTIRVIAFKGTTAVATSIGTITGAETGLTATKQNDGTTNASIAIAVSTSLNQAGTLTIPVTVDGVTINLQYSWALAVKGANGSPGSPGQDGYTTTIVTMYQRSASQPSKPVFTITYDFSTGQISGAGATGWSTTPPAVNANHDPLWIMTGLAYARGATSTTLTNLSTPVKYIEDVAGADGKTLRGPTVYDPNFPYQGREGSGTIIDLVVNTVQGQPDYSHLYLCKKDSTGNAPTNTTYWEETTWQDFVATKVFFAAYAFVQNLGANAIKIQDAGANVYGGFMPPGNTVEGNGDYVFWVGSSTPANAKAWVDRYGSAYFNGTVRASILYKSLSRYTVTVPNSLTLTSSCSDIIVVKLVGTTGSSTLNLPSASSMEGRILEIYTQGSSGSTTKLLVSSLKDITGSTLTSTDLKGEAKLYSDGTDWILLQVFERGR